MKLNISVVQEHAKDPADTLTMIQAICHDPDSPMDYLITVKGMGSGEYRWKATNNRYDPEYDTKTAMEMLAELFDVPVGEDGSFGGDQTLGIAAVWASERTFVHLVMDIFANA